jgi:excisionase family DNA binding protein
MEFPTIDNSAKLAKSAESARLARVAENEALLARLAREGIKPSQLPPDEFRAYIKAAIDAAREPSEQGKDHSGDVDESDDDDELIEPPVPAPAPAHADGLKTPAQAARRLNISIRTLRGLIASGELRYVNVGRGKQREKVMFTDSDLDDLIASRTRQKVQECPSTSPKARRITNMISSGEVLDFTARQKRPTSGKRRR